MIEPVSMNSSTMGRGGDNRGDRRQVVQGEGTGEFGARPLRLPHREKLQHARSFPRALARLRQVPSQPSVKAPPRAKAMNGSRSESERYSSAIASR